MCGIKFLLVINLLATERIICALILTPDSSNSSLIHNGAIKILTECLKNEVVTGMMPTVGVIGASDDFFSLILSLTHPIPIILLDGKHDTVGHEIFYKEQPKINYRKVKYIVNIVCSRYDLVTSLRVWASSIWRNVAARFIIVEGAPLTNHCKNAHEYSETLWSFDLINSIVICTNSKGNLILYSFNPFNSQAPEPWREVSTLNTPVTVEHERLYIFEVGIESHDLVIFRRTFNEIITCKSTFFEKDLTLNGYPVRIGAGFRETMMMSIVDNRMFNENLVRTIKWFEHLKSHKVVNIHMTQDKWKMFAGFDKDIMETLFTFLNATVMLNMDLSYDWRAKTMVQSITELEAFLDEPIFDIILNSNYLSFILDNALKKTQTLRSVTTTPRSVTTTSKYYKSEEIKKFMALIAKIELEAQFKTRLPWKALRGYKQMIYPVTQRDITIITNNRGYVDFFTRLVSFLDPRLWISMLIVSCVGVIGLKFTGRQSFGAVILNSLRFSLGIAIQPIPTGLPARIILGCLMPYFLIMVTSFQSYVSYILTVPRALSNVDSLSDLQNLGYNISVGYDYVYYSKSSVVADRIEMHEGLHCTEVVLNNTQAACIDDSVYLKSQAAKYKTLHVMKEPLGTTYVTYFTRADWPLHDRFDTLLSRLRESGIVNFFLKRYEEPSEIGINVAAEEREANEAKEMERMKFKRTFILLLIGLAVSTIIFFIELLVFQVKKLNFNHCATLRLRKIRPSRK